MVMDPALALVGIMGGWALLVLLAAGEVYARARAAAPEPAPPAPPRAAAWALVGVALAVALVRAGFALDRAHYNVDECQYAATADYARRTGTSIFGPRNLGLHQWLYLLGSLESPFAAADVATSLAVGLAGGLLGLLVLRARRDALGAWLAPPALALGLLPLEGLTSNKEPWGALGAAGWALVRLGWPAASAGRQLAAGACLGLAVAMKEQAGPLVLAEAAVGLADAARAVRAGAVTRGEAARRFVRDEALAAAGFWLGLAPLLLGLLWHGALGGFFRFLLDMAQHGGTPVLDLCRVIEAPPPPPTPGRSLPELAVAALVGLFPLASGPVTFLGLSLLARLGVEVRALLDPERRLELGAAALALAGAGAASIGGRWFTHYLMLAVPGLALLAALRLADALRAARARRLPYAVAAVLGLAAFLAANLVGFLAQYPAGAEGEGSFWGPEGVKLRALAAEVRRHTPEGSTLFVWGWRPELYVAAGRRPASRYVGGLTATRAEALADLRRERPAAVVLEHLGLFATGQHDPYSLDHHPALVAWLQAEGYRTAARVEAWTVLVRPGAR